MEGHPEQAQRGTYAFAIVKIDNLLPLCSIISSTILGLVVQGRMARASGHELLYRAGSLVKLSAGLTVHSSYRRRYVV